MPVSTFIFNSAKAGWANGMLCYWSSPTASFYATLVLATYIPYASHVYASAFSNCELSSVSFTPGHSGTMAQALVSCTLTINQVSNQVEYLAAPLSWAGLSAGVAAALIIYQKNGVSGAGSAGLSPLVLYTSMGGFPIATNGTDFVISYTSAGWFVGVDVSA